MVATVARCFAADNSLRVYSRRGAAGLAGGRSCSAHRNVSSTPSSRRRARGRADTTAEDFLLLGDQKLLEFARTHRGVERQSAPDCFTAPVDLGRDRVEALDTFDRRRMRAGECVGQGPVGVGGRRVLRWTTPLAAPRSRRSTPALPCHGLTVLRVRARQPSPLPQWPPDLHAGAERADPHGGSGMGCFDDKVVADRQLHMACRGKDQVARTDLGTGNRYPVVDLLISGAVQVNSRPRVRPLGQPRAIELVRARSRPTRTVGPAATAPRAPRCRRDCSAGATAVRWTPSVSSIR